MRNYPTPTRRQFLQSTFPLIVSAATLKGATISLSTTALIKGTVKLMAWTKLKTTAVIGAAVLLAAGTATVAVRQLASKPGPAAAWWPAEYNADDATGWHRGSPDGNVSFAAGKVGQAFSFDGASQVVVPDSPELNPTGALTLEAWIHPEPPFGSISPPIIKKSGIGSARTEEGQSTGYALELRDPDSVILGVYLAGAPGTWTFSAEAPVPMNEWSHVAGVFDGEKLVIYLNGEPVGTPTPATGTMVPSSNDLQIGHDPSNLDRYFKGLIDEPAVFDRALSPAEIRADYQAGSAGKPRARRR